MPATLGDWVEVGRDHHFGPTSDQGLATVDGPGGARHIVYRGGWSIPRQLKAQGWDHIGDPDGHGDLLFDAYQTSSGGAKMFAVTGPDGAVHPFPHRLVADEQLLSWASDVDPGTIRQAEKTARLPIVEGHVALMPDAHVGIGATVGSVIPTRGAVIPSAVGVDIGCGMVAAELDVTERQLPDDLEPLLFQIEKAIPAGVGKGHDRVARHAEQWLAAHRPATDLAAQMAGKVWLSKRAAALVDEIPAAYKDIDQVMADQSDLVEIRHTLRQVLNYKGT